MDMRSLLNPDVDNGTTGDPPPVAKPRKQPETSIFVKPALKSKKAATVAPTPPLLQLHSSSASESPAGSEVYIPQTEPYQRSSSIVSIDESLRRESITSVMSVTPESRKRIATSEPPTEEPASKRARTRPYAERPIWAQLARSNPRYQQASHENASSYSSSSRGRVPEKGARASEAPKQQLPPKPNGNHANTGSFGGSSESGGPVMAPPSPGNNASQQPWLQNPPLDNDLIVSRQIFGQWEKSVCWNQPFGDLEKAVADWFYVQLKALDDVDNSAECVIEIEAKIGRIIQKNSDERIRLPVKSATVLEEAWTRKETKFESQMDEPEHKAMNQFLNSAIQESLQPGRVKMQYKHPRETDSFRPLSAAGLQALPAAFRARRALAGRDLKLRTSTDQAKNVTARIVKLHVADLHIYNPNHHYDCRISINLEANMNRPELQPFDDLVEPVSWQDAVTKREIIATPDRKKDRLSYKHLAYSFDLTRVDVKGLDPKYELELELDAEVLRGCLGGPGFATVVSGFLDNATFLMRQRPVGES